MESTTLTPASAPPTILDSVERQLKTASAITIGFALLIGAGSFAPTDWPTRLLADVMFLPWGSEVELTEEGRLLAAILGGVMTAWALTYWLMTDLLLRNHPKELKRIIMITIPVWFVLDSAGSIAAGAWINAIANSSFLVMFVVPARRL